MDRQIRISCLRLLGNRVGFALLLSVILVSCGSTGSKVAGGPTKRVVGSNSSNSVRAPVHLSGGAPHFVSMPHQLQSDKTSLSDVTCYSDMNCIGVGERFTYPFTTALVVTSSDQGNTWSDSNTLPSELSGISQLSNVGCVPNGKCVAFGTVGSSNSRDQSLVAITTTDGGIDWQPTALPRSISAFTNQVINGLECLSSSICFAVGIEWNLSTGIGAAQPIILESTNAGVSWNELNPPKGVLTISDISCPTSSTCWITGAGPGSSGENQSMVFESQNSGVDWQEVSPPQSVFVGGSPNGSSVGNLGRVSCLSATQCQFIGEIDPTQPSPSSVSFPIAVVAGTNDGGKTWEVEQRGSPQVNNQYTSVVCSPPGTCYVAGEGIEETTDGGANWTPVSISPTAVAHTSRIAPQVSSSLSQNSSLSAITILSSGSVIAVGSGGEIVSGHP
jgi:hypothetical protein